MSQRQPNRPAGQASAASGGKRQRNKSATLLKAGVLASVRWLDAAFDLDKEAGPCEMVTVGWVIKHNGQQITLAGEKSAASDYFRAYTSIPAGMILEISTLAPAN